VGAVGFLLGNCLVLPPVRDLRVAASLVALAGQGNGDGRELVCGLNRDAADDLAGHVGAQNAGGLADAACSAATANSPGFG
jgi:hypothetical protein